MNTYQYLPARSQWQSKTLSLTSRGTSRINGIKKIIGAIRRIVFYICHLFTYYISDNIRGYNRERFGEGKLSKEPLVNSGQKNE